MGLGLWTEGLLALARRLLFVVLLGFEPIPEAVIRDVGGS